MASLQYDQRSTVYGGRCTVYGVSLLLSQGRHTRRRHTHHTPLTCRVVPPVVSLSLSLVLSLQLLAL